MTAVRLLGLYPRAWRERYGPEFLDLVGTGDLRARQVLDISLGALDAWLSADVRSASGDPVSINHRGVAMMTALRSSCATKSTLSPWEIFIGTSLILGGTLAMVTAGSMLKQAGYADVSEAIMSLSFTIPMAISSHYMYMRRYSWRVQIAFTGSLIAILIAIAAWNAG